MITKFRDTQSGKNRKSCHLIAQSAANEAQDETQKGGRKTLMQREGIICFQSCVDSTNAIHALRVRRSDSDMSDSDTVAQGYCDMYCV
jgi:hypothetical protein